MQSQSWYHYPDKRINANTYFNKLLAHILISSTILISSPNQNLTTKDNVTTQTNVWLL